MLWAVATLNCNKTKRLKRFPQLYLPSIKDYTRSTVLAVSAACHCIQRPRRNCPHQASQVKAYTSINAILDVVYGMTIMITLCTFYRLHAKLNEEEEAAKLYNRFVAQAETSDVSHN